MRPDRRHSLGVLLLLLTVAASPFVLKIDSLVLQVVAFAVEIAVVCFSMWLQGAWPGQRNNINF